MDNAKNIRSVHGEHIFNIMEDAVVDQVKASMARDKDICSCDICVYDAAAIALNKLTPHYITTNKGELYARVLKLNASERMEITVEVLQAIEIVRNRKTHD
ncbi:MAG: late competence development ComFB family protein [Oscillospiraceae bacterium]|nr:late competence development ComFB family protein [Oscillospiraceae bacterium]